MEFTTKKVQIGGDGEVITIGRFRGLKAIEVAAVVADIIENVPQVTDKANKFVKDFEASNSVTLTPAMTRLPRYRVIGLEPEDVANEPGGTLTIPQPPTVQQQLMHVLPDLFKVARAQVTRMIGLVAIPNSELEVADDNDNVNEACLIHGKRLVRQAYVDQLAELIVASWEVITSQFADREDLRASLGELPLLRELLSMDQNRASKGSRPVPQEEPPPTSKTSRLESPNSSIDSPVPTDGTDELSSIEPLGASSSA